MRAGIGSHKRTLAVAVVDDAGRQIAIEAFRQRPQCHLRLGKWLADHGVTRVGIEGSGHLGRAAAAWLVDVGLDVREVPCRFTVRERRRRAGAGSPTRSTRWRSPWVTAREEDLVAAAARTTPLKSCGCLVITAGSWSPNGSDWSTGPRRPGHRRARLQGQGAAAGPPLAGPRRPPAAARQDRSPGRADPPPAGPGRRVSRLRPHPVGSAQMPQANGPYGERIPRSRARRTASLRLEAASFRKMFRTWVRTVFTETNMTPAISSVVSSSAR
jgi:hypothetical protein